MIRYLRFKASNIIAEKLSHNHSAHTIKLKYWHDKKQIVEISCQDARSACMDEEAFVTAKGHTFGCTCSEPDCIRRPTKRYY